MPVIVKIEVELMRNFFYRMQNAIARFMYGRNGMDQLNQGLFFSYIALWLLGLVLGIFIHGRAFHSLLNVLTLALCVAILFRAFSKNLAKRREENSRYLQWIGPKKTKFTVYMARKRDKEHKYFTCSNCKTVCRVPTGKGRIEITCPKCGNKIRGKS